MSMPMADCMMSSFPHSVQSIYDMPKLRELFNKAKFARCRARFAVPVILFEGKVSNLLIVFKIKHAGLREI